MIIPTNTLAKTCPDFTPKGVNTNYLILNRLVQDYQSLLPRVPAVKGIVIDRIKFNRGVDALVGITNIYIRNLGNSAATIISLLNLSSQVYL